MTEEDDSISLDVPLMLVPYLVAESHQEGGMAEPDVLCCLKFYAIDPWRIDQSLPCHGGWWRWSQRGRRFHSNCLQTWLQREEQ